MDLKLGVRMLAKTPGLTAVAVTALAVAIGAGAAYLEFMRDALYPTLPVAGLALMLVVCAFVVAVAMIACAAPLRRALRIEPTQALRADG